MTAVDQDEAAERAARELARRLGPITPLRDPYAAGLDFMRWLQTEHWRCLPPAPDPIEQARNARPVPPTDDYLAAKAAITRKDT